MHYCIFWGTCVLFQIKEKHFCFNKSNLNLKCSRCLKNPRLNCTVSSPLHYLCLNWTAISTTVSWTDVICLCIFVILYQPAVLSLCFGYLVHTSATAWDPTVNLTEAFAINYQQISNFSHSHTCPFAHISLLTIMFQSQLNSLFHSDLGFELRLAGYSSFKCLNHRSCFYFISQCAVTSNRTGVSIKMANACMVL